MFMTQMSSAPVNLFLTRMFYKTSFKAWHKEVEIYLKKKAHDKQQQALKEKADLTGDRYEIKEFVNLEEEQTEIIECEYETEKVFVISPEEAKLYKDDYDDIKSVKSETQKNLTQNSQHGVFESPENFRKLARHRLSSNTKRYPKPKFKGEEIEQPEEQERSTEKKKHRMMIVHTAQEALAQSDYQYVDPNSTEYQNVVMENKINKHQKSKTRSPNVFRLGYQSGVQLTEDERLKSKYQGGFRVSAAAAANGSSKSQSRSPPRVNDPLWESRKTPTKKRSTVTFAK